MVDLVAQVLEDFDSELRGQVRQASSCSQKTRKSEIRSSICSRSTLLLVER